MLRREIQGERHSETTKAMLNLADTYILRSRHNAALELLNGAEGIIAEILGVTHPEYLRCQRIKSRAQSLNNSVNPEVISTE